VFNSRVTILDDGGNVVPLFDEGMMARLRDDRAARIANAAYDRSRGRTLGTGEIVVCSLTGVMVIAMLAMNDMGVWRPRPHLHVLVATMVILSPLMVIGRRFMRKAQAGRVRAALLSEGLCASCGYELPNTGPSKGGRRGLVQCPECGGWWKERNGGSLGSQRSGANDRI
jgi:hypothetical protein